MGSEVKFLPAGDNGIILELGKEISKTINERIRRWICFLQLYKNQFQEIVELIPTYTSILIIYDPLQISYQDLKEKLLKSSGAMGSIQLPPPQVLHVPVVYGGEYGPDIEFVAKHNGLMVEDVINLHSSPNYLIYMIGFTPGFPYLGGMEESITTPRLQTPREKIPAGSVGIAGSQTGIYPIESPGGWQLIGRTPLKLFDSSREPAVLFQAGDYIKFEEITHEEYIKLEAVIKEGNYQVKITQWRDV